MFGKILGKALSLPVKVANVPMRILEKIGDEFEPPRSRHRGKRTISRPLSIVAETIEELCEELD